MHRILIIVSAFGLALATVARTCAQDGALRAQTTSAPQVIATATAERVRFAAPNVVAQLRLEVYNETGQKLFDTEQRGGSVLDWHLQDGAGGSTRAHTCAS